MTAIVSQETYNYIVSKRDESLSEAAQQETQVEAHQANVDLFTARATQYDIIIADLEVEEE